MYVADDGIYLSAEHNVRPLFLESTPRVWNRIDTQDQAPLTIPFMITLRRRWMQMADVFLDQVNFSTNTPPSNSSTDDYSKD